MTFFEILMSLSVSLIQSPNNSSKSAINLVDKGLYATMNRWRIDFYFYFFLFIPHIPHVFRFKKVNMLRMKDLFYTYSVMD